MGMPVILEIRDTHVDEDIFTTIFNYFVEVDERFSTYKEQSEIMRINRNEIPPADYSSEVKEVFRLSEETKELTNGYFDITRSGVIDPSGLVKGWAINNAATMLLEQGYKNFFVEIGGDIQVQTGENMTPWSIGVRNPFNKNEIVKVFHLRNEGIATSGTYVRGQHIYNPKAPKESLNDVASITVIGPNIYEADRFATAAFAMGKQGIAFIENLSGFEGYMIDKDGQATLTSGLYKFTTPL